MNTANWHDAGLSPSPVFLRPGQGDVTAAATRRGFLGLAALGLIEGYSKPILATSTGTLTWAVHVSLTPAWFDPADENFTSAAVTGSLLWNLTPSRRVNA